MAHDLFSLCILCIAVAPVVAVYPDAGELEVRLVNGKTKFQGRLEVRRNESEPWGTVCDDGFDQNDAKVVCRMLGFTDTEYSTYFKEPSPFGSGTGKVLLDQVDCAGTETNIAQCNNSGWGVSICHHNEDVGVNCQTPIRLIGSPHSGMVEIQSNNTWKPLCYDRTDENIGKVLCRMLALSAGNVLVKPGYPSNEVYYDGHPVCKGNEHDIYQCHITKMGCHSNTQVDLNCRTVIRLQGGPHNQSGRVEVFFQDRWGTICDDSFESTREEPAAAVICRMLGFKTKGAVHKGGAHYGEGTGDVLIEKLECKGDENDIADCDSKQWGSHSNCRHSEDVSVECGTEVRLVGGPTPFSGRLEINNENKWKTMCDASLDNRTAQVVCNMLGFIRGNVSVLGGAYYGQGTGEIVDYALNCYGNETDIADCQHDYHSTKCNHSQDMGINCYSVTPIRLQGGPTPFSGRVEIWSNLQQNWTAVCDSIYGFTVNDAKVLCNMIGKPNNSPTFHRASLLYDYVIHGKGIAYMRCKGTEKDITDCISGQSWNQSTCDSPYYVGINCDPVTPIRLVDGYSNMAGRVEIYFNNTWGSICWNGYSSYLPPVLCKMMGSRESARLLSSNEFNQANASTVINSIDCSRYPDDISDCKAAPWNTSNQCSSRIYVGIACGSQVRLANGTSKRLGRVEVNVNGSWKSICATGFDENSGNVVCRMLGFNVWNVSVLPGNYFGRGDGDIFLNATNCTGKEDDLTTCRSGPWEQAECKNDEVAAIDCQYWNTELRLVNGKTPYSGRVEVFFNNRWGTVCEVSFTKEDAAVVCRTIGYNFSADPKVESNLYDGNFTPDHVSISSLTCKGDEQDISMCTSNRWELGYSYCHSYTWLHSVGVNCLTSVQLSGGTEATGQVEVYHKESWITICNDNFVETNIPVLCNLLGFNYTQDYMMIDNRFYPSYYGQIAIQNLTCTGEEIDIHQCHFDSWGTAVCGDGNLAAISCHTPVQLVGENNWYRGLLQIWSHDQWMDVCYDKYNIAQQTRIGSIVCRMLGIPNSRVRVYAINGDNDTYTVLCSGNEKDISQCNLTRSTCPNHQRFALSCGKQETSIRLSGGTDAIGQVEVYHGGYWTTICNDNFVEANIPVLCFMLNFGYTQNYTMIENRFHTSYDKNPTIQNLTCMGKEIDIKQCRFESTSTTTCSSRSAVAISCHSPVQLVGEDNRYRGGLQIWAHNQWMDVCNDTYKIAQQTVIGNIVCRMLGMTNPKVRVYSVYGGNNTLAVSCSEYAKDISQCNLTQLSCPHQERLAISCDINIKIENGRTDYMGAVSFQMFDHWGTIEQIKDENAAKVACKTLGFELWKNAEIQSSRDFRKSLSCTYINIPLLDCTGNETDIRMCNNTYPAKDQYSYYSCYSASVGVNCQTQVRLTNGSQYQYGVIEVKSNRSWFPVCSENFTIESAYVFCRMLGHKHVRNATFRHDVHTRSNDTMVAVKCNGSEVDISECENRLFETCSSGAAVHLDCRSTIRIADGPTPFIGRVEVFYEGRWGTISRTNSALSATLQVLCKILGFNYAGAQIYNNVQTISRTGVTNHTVNYLQCVGTEDDITECSSELWMSQKEYYDTGALEIECLNPISLVGGSNANVGKVQVSYNSTYLSVCGDNFTLADADVVCRKIGKETNKNATIYFNNKYGSGYSYVISNMQCLGNESDIQACQSDQWFNSSNLCNPRNNAVSVNCQPRTPIRFQGSSSNTGVVEINYNGYWGTLCFNGFDRRDAYVICRMLGFKSIAAYSYTYAERTSVTRNLGCQGYEKDISECSNSDNSWFHGLDCNDDYHSTDQIATVTCSDNWIRLQDGVNDYQGRVEIPYIGLTEICDNNFDAVDADVVCRYFGFHDGNKTIHKAGHFGMRSSDLIIYDLNCTGQENDVDECASYPWSSNQYLCNTYAGGAGVNCKPTTPIRLVNGTNAYSGRLEVEYKGSYGTVCDRNFDENDAKVVCRMLGFSTRSSDVRQRAFYGQGTGKIVISHLNCYGNEPDISECKADYRWDSPYANCEHSDDVSVQCDTPVRLHDGWTAFSGSVEVYINGSWHSVCIDGFTQNDAKLICNITGLKKNYERDVNVTIHKESYYGIRSKQTLIGNLNCSGEEDDLFYCGAAKWTTQLQACHADDNVAINCRPSTSIRLMKGTTEVNLTAHEKCNVSGRVEVYYNNKWGTICDDQFDDSDALVICKMMEFDVGHVSRVTGYGLGNGAILVDDLECLGTEKDISECKAREWGTHNCDHDEDISVTCDCMKNFDPCNSADHVRLPNLEFRHLNTNTSTLKSAYNDSKLPVSWYYVGTNSMLNDTPPFNSCGTHYPIYSTDELPEPGVIKTINATQVGDKTISYNIRVKTCNISSNHTEYVYELGPTRNDQSGYCFGIGTSDPPPTFVAKEVSSFIRDEPYDVSFGCKFTLSDEDLLYQVFWYIEGNYEHSFTKQYFNRSRLLELDITEDDFLQFGIGLGIDISCAVRAFRTQDGQPGPMSDRSPPLFAGIQVLTPSITLRKGETKSIMLKNTMPFVCKEDFSNVCFIKLLQNIPHDNSCSSTVTFASEACSTSIYNTSIKEINITTSETDQYGVHGHFKVNVLFKPYTDNYRNVVKFWKRQYKLPEISVHVLPEADKTWRGKLCTAQNDPHMHTFDGKAYEHHEEVGEYILYRHRIFDNVEIQHKIASCVGTDSEVKCNCGVAVRSGRDVYVINVCERLLDIGFKRCEDESLTVKKNNDFTYTIYLPFGTAVRARIDSQPWMGNEGGRVVDISVLPSVYDQNGTSSGLCGSNNDDMTDDFRHRNGSLIKNTSGHKLFINSWKVKEEESLFSSNVYKMTLNPWSFPSCVCGQTNKDDNIVEPDNHMTCDRSLTECAPGVTSGQHSCGRVSERRSVRSVDKRPRIPLVMQTNHYESTNQLIRQKREAEMGALSARQQCENYFRDLQAFELCKKVPATHTNRSVENCELDIILTNSTLWMTISRQSMQDACLTEIHRNTSVREEVLNTVKNESIQKNSNDRDRTTISPVQLTAMLKEIEEIENIVEQIADITCLNNCSGHGQCVNGTCDCEKNFGATDCSLDINKPPRIDEVLDKGLCDEKDHACSHIYVFGEVFAGTNLTCRLERFTMKPGEIKTRHSSNAYTLKGTADSLIEAICPIHQIRSKRSTNNDEQPPNDFVYGFRVTVSNDGNTFGDQTEDVYIFDSTCQAWSNSSGEMTFSLKDGHCYINGRCVSNGTVSISQKMVCDTENSKFAWTEITTLAPTTSTSTTTPSTSYVACTCVSNNTASCSAGQCICKEGWNGKQCKNDIDECESNSICADKPNTACQNTLGHFECLCSKGYEMSSDNLCKATVEANPASVAKKIVESKPNQQAFTIELRIDMNLNSSFNLNASSTYKKVETAAKDALTTFYQKKLGIGFRDVVILSLRPGSLYIQHAVITKTEEFVVSALSVAIADLSRGETLRMFDVDYQVHDVKTENTGVGTSGDNLQNFLLCESYKALHPCASDESCVVEQEKPICKKKDSPSDTSNLITIISSSVGGFLILVIITLVACLCRSKMNNRKQLNARQSPAEPNMYHDMNSTEMLERPRKQVEEGHTSAANPAYDTRSYMSEGSYYKDGYLYYYGKK